MQGSTIASTSTRSAASAYELIAGEPPFAGRSAASLIRAHFVDAPAPIATRRADVPAGACRAHRALPREGSGRSAGERA